MGGKLWKLRYGAKGVSEARWRAAGRGMDWKGKGDGLKTGLTWTVFLKGTLALSFWVVTTQVCMILKLIKLTANMFAFTVC